MHHLSMLRVALVALASECWRCHPSRSKRTRLKMAIGYVGVPRAVIGAVSVLTLPCQRPTLLDPSRGLWRPLHVQHTTGSRGREPLDPVKS
jgi:hypothetical protein